MSVQPSAVRAAAVGPGPILGVKITEECAGLVARDAFFWAWPLVNLMIRLLFEAKVTGSVVAGPTSLSPLNHLGCPSKEETWLPSSC